MIREEKGRVFCVAFVFVFLRRTAPLSRSYRRQVCGVGLNYLRSRVGRALILQADAPFPSTPFLHSVGAADPESAARRWRRCAQTAACHAAPPRRVFRAGWEFSAQPALLRHTAGVPPFFPSRSAVVRSRAVGFGCSRLTRKRGRLNRLSSGLHSIQTMFTHHYDDYYDYYVHFTIYI